MQVFSISVAMLVGACATEPGLGSTAGPTFAEFEAHTFHETFAGGAYIVDGDRPIENEKQLYELWQSFQEGALAVNTVGGNDDRWDEQAKLHISYCVNNDFGSNKPAVVAALAAATVGGWETMANVHFEYLTGEDGAGCTAATNTVVFDVRQTSGQAYLARSFLPSSPRAARELYVDTSSFDPAVPYPLAHIVGHELGHILGLRHENTRPEAGTCFENNDWRALTPYDSASIMHYPQCNGTSHDMSWTATDAVGIAALYGPPIATSPPMVTGTPRSQTESGVLAAGSSQPFGPFAVASGNVFAVTMTGTGDPDLYVRWGAPPTTTSYNCRPYLNGPDEQCSVSSTTSNQAYVMVRAYAAATFALNIAWTAP